MSVGRNDPCPCGSGKKYKRCHLDADALAARPARPAGRTEDAGPRSELEIFAEPLLDATDGSPEMMERAMNMATVFWSAAELPEAERARVLEEAASTIASEKKRAEFLEIAELMIRRRNEA